MNTEATATESCRLPPPIAVFLRGDHQGSEAFSYLIANRTVLTDLPLPELDPFRRGEAEPQSRPEVESFLHSGEWYFSGRGWVGGRLVEVRCGKTSGFHLLEVEGAGRFLVGADGRSIIAADGHSSARREARLALLGPCLSLALAAGGTFCLHAGALVREGSVVALMGETGMGKSTLSEFAEQESGGWRRLADDVLPVALVSGELRALPHFPQLKLSPEEQWDLTQAPELPLLRIYRLHRSDSGEGIGIRPLTMRDAALAVLRSTVAARLFDPLLRERHLDWAAQVAETRGVQRLVFPSGLDRLRQVFSEIRNDVR